MMPPGGGGGGGGRQPRIPSMLSLVDGGGGGGGSANAVRRQSCAANLPSPSVHVPSISGRLSNGFPPRPEGFERVIVMQNGGSGVRRCEEDGISATVDNLNGGGGGVANESNHNNNDDGGVKSTTAMKSGPLGIVKRICSEGVLSVTSFGSGSSDGSASGNYWMLMITPVVSRFVLL